MPHQVITRQLAFQQVDPEDPMVPVGDEVIVERGGMVPEWVLPFTISALTNSGLIVGVTEPDPAIVPASALPAQPRTPDQPLILPSDPNGTPLPPGLPADVVVPEQAGTSPVGEPATATPGAPPAQKPSRADSKAEWEAYAVSVGVPQGRAESMNKTDLIAEVNRRETQQ